MRRIALLAAISLAAASCGGPGKQAKIEQKGTDDATLASATLPSQPQQPVSSAVLVPVKPAPSQVQPKPASLPQSQPTAQSQTKPPATPKAEVASDDAGKGLFPPSAAEKPKTPRASAKVKAAANFEEAKARAEEALKELEKRKKAREAEKTKKAATEPERTAGALPQPGAPSTGGGKSEEVVSKYLALLKSPGTSEEKKPEILVRLAELAYEDEVAALKVAYEMGTYVNLKSGERYPRSVKYYREIVDKYPDSQQSLTAFYNLGYLYSEERMLFEAAEVYKEVLRRDPNSPYTLEIQMRLGEAAFSQSHYKEAAAYYEDVVAGNRDDYRDKANYKLGWCQYKLEDYGAAIKVFNRILNRPEGAPHDLVVETIDIMGKCFVEKGGTAEVDQYLANTGTAKIYGDLIYQKVGTLLADRSRHTDAVKAFERAIEAYPLTDTALDVEKGLIAAYNNLRDTEAVNLRRARWAELYAPGTEWDKANGPTYGTERDRMLEEGLRLAALYRHSRAQRGEGGLDAALDIYQRYGKLYGDQTENGYEMAFAYAQALKEAERWKEAQHVYAKVARNEKRTAHREEAAYKRIEALDQLRQRDNFWFDEFIASHEEYVKLNPASPLVPQFIFAVGELYFGVDKFSPAREAFLRVSDKFPDHKLTPTAVERVSRTWFRENKYVEAEREGRRALSLGLDSGPRSETLKLVSFCIFKQAESAQDSGDLSGSVKHFFRLAEEFPGTEAAQVSLYRGAELLRKLGREEESASVYRRLADAYGESKYAQSALTLSSEILSALGQWKGVAENYEKLYRMNPGDPEAENNLFKAAVAREKADDQKPAAALFGEYASKFPDSKRYAQALYRQAVLVEKMGDMKSAFDLWERIWASKAEGEEEIYRARVGLKIAEKEFESFKAVELKGNLKKTMADKEQRLERTLNKLAAAAAFPYAETLPASLYRAAESFELMKASILESERPKGMNAEELEQYQFLLEEKAAPLEERAIDLYRRGVAASRKANIQNEWVERMYSRLEVLMPYAYQRTEQAVSAFPNLPYPGKGWARSGGAK